MSFVNSGKPVSVNTKWLKRQAIQLAGQLPEDHDEALKVIQYLELLTKNFLTDDEASFDTEKPGQIQKLTVVT